MHNPLVSIIIPTYNRANLIAETLESIAAQTYSNWECIIVDDGSNDNSEEIISIFLSDHRFQFHHRPADKLKGANGCRNYGFEISKGEYINWFDSDDIMLPDFIETKIKSFASESHPDAIISKRGVFVDDSKAPISFEQRTITTHDIFTDFITFKITWYLPDVMWVRSFLKNKQLFDEQLLAGQDRDFHVRMLLEEPNVLIINNYLTLCRFHSGNITSNFNDIKNNRLKVSHLYGVVKMMELLRQKGKLSFPIQHCYFKTMMKYLPYVIGNSKDTAALYKLLKSLSVLHYDVFLGWCKFLAAHAALNMTGRGASILK